MHIHTNDIPVMPIIRENLPHKENLDDIRIVDGFFVL